jgi:hypothetical protein
MRQHSAKVDFVPQVIIAAIEQNLKQYIMIDKQLSEQLTDPLIKSIARGCKNISDHTYLVSEYGLDEYLAKSVYAIVTTIINSQQ